MMKAGYTLIEILMTLSILSILGMGSLSFARTFIHQNDQSVQVRRLIGALQYARMEAIRRGETIVFCGSSDFQKCDGDWRHGQMIKVHDQVLRVFSELRSGDYWEWKSSLGKNHQLEFSSLGFTRGQQGSFYYHAREKEYIYRIVVSHSGTIRVEKM